MHETHNGGGGNGRASRLDPSDRIELSDPASERVVLYSLSQFPQLFETCGLTEQDFGHTPHRLIFEALRDLHANGGDTDVPALRARLIAAGRFGIIGGDEGLCELGDCLPTPKPPFGRVRELALRRRIDGLLALVRVKLTEPGEFERYFAQLIEARAELEALSAPPTSRFPTFSEAVMQIGNAGERLAMGIPSLDQATRGGLPLGRFVAVLGAPGASKTNLSTWLADKWERAGAAVLFMAADESRESIVTRLGQLDGFDRSRLECTDDGGRLALARQGTERSATLMVIDPFEDKISLEQAESILISRAGTRPRVMFVDSLQTVPCDAADQLETAREIVAAKVEVCKRIAKRGTLVIAISEMSRAGYRSANEKDNISALAAGAESRAIEYAAHLILGLRPVKGEKGVSDVEVAKNRLGSDKPDLRLKLDFETLGFCEIDKPDTDTVQVEGEIKRFAIARDKITKAIRRDKLGQLRTVNAIVIESHVKRNTAVQVVRDMLEEGAIVKVDGVYRLGPTGAN